MLRGRISQDEQTDRARKLSFGQCQSHWSVGKQAVAVIDSVTHKTSRFFALPPPTRKTILPSLIVRQRKRGGNKPALVLLQF